MKKYNLISMKLFFLFVIILCSSYVFAARPLNTDDAYIIGQNEYEVEIGYDYVKQTDTKENAVSLKQSINNKSDFYISIPSNLDSEKGLGEAELGVKFGVANISTLSYAISFSNVMGKRQYTLNNIISKDFNKFMTHINFLYEAQSDSDEKGVFNYLVACEVPMKFGLTVMGEIMLKPKSNIEDDTEKLLGLSYNFGYTTFDIGTTLKDQNTDQVLTCGLTYAF